MSGDAATHASVLPDPVTASTTTSLLPRNSGMVLLCTGVGLEKPMAAMASSNQADSDGVSAAHARGALGVSADMG